MPVEVWTNDGLGTVTAGGTGAPAPGSPETWTVTATNAFPVAATGATPPTQFYVADQNASFATEKILVTVAPGGTGAGQTWTVTRGADGTTPLAHTASFTIVQVVTRASLWSLAGIAPSGDTTGATDTARITAALAGSGQQIRLQSGAFYISSRLTVGNNQSLTGSGHGTFIVAGSAYSDSRMISINGPGTTVGNFQLNGGASATTASNPVTDGIYIDNSANFVANVTVADVLINAVNGWGVNFADSSLHGAPIDCSFRNVFGYANGGIRVSAATAETFSLRLQGCAVAADLGAATLDSFLLQNVFDADLTDCYGGGNSAATAGHGLHLNGHCSAVRVRGGEFSANNVASGSGVCALLIDDSGTGSVMCEFTDTVFQTADLGVSLQNNCHEITLTGCDIQNNNLNGAVVNTVSNDIRFIGCRFGTQAANGQHNPAGTVYDLKWSSTAHGSIDGCWFLSPVVAAPSAGVQGAIDFGLAGSAIWLRDPLFLGTGSTTANQITNRPQMVRASLIVGTATLAAGTVTVTAAYITAAMRIELRYLTPAGTPGAVFVNSVTAATNFVIKSTSATDTSVVEYEVFL